MICMETIAKIRRLYYKETLSIRAITLKLNLNRRTVKKHIEQTVVPPYQKPVKRYPQLGAYLTHLDLRLTEAQTQPKIKRMTACHHYEWLKSCGYQGSYSSVSAYVRQFNAQSPTNPIVFIPQHFPLGDAYQFDWSTESIKIAGVVQKTQVAHFRLCHSRAFFVRAYPNQKMEMLIDSSGAQYATA